MKKKRSMGSRIAALVAVVFGLLTIKSGGAHSGNLTYINGFFTGHAMMDL